MNRKAKPDSPAAVEQDSGVKTEKNGTSKEAAEVMTEAAAGNAEKRKSSEAAAKDEAGYSVRRLAVSLLAMLFAIYAFLVMSFAWFNISNDVTGRDMEVEATGVDSREFRLYQWTGTSETVGSWIEISSLNFTDGVPNEVRRYMIVCDSSLFLSARFSFTGESVVGTNPDNESLFDYVYLSKVSESTAGVSIDPSTNVVTYDYGTDDTDYFNYTDSTTADSISSGLDANRLYTVPCSHQALVFDVYISKDVCNTFSNWGFTGLISLK